MNISGATGATRDLPRWPPFTRSVSLPEAGGRDQLALLLVKPGPLPALQSPKEPGHLAFRRAVSTWTCRAGRADRAGRTGRTGKVREPERPRARACERNLKTETIGADLLYHAIPCRTIVLLTASCLRLEGHVVRPLPSSTFFPCTSVVLSTALATTTQSLLRRLLCHMNLGTSHHGPRHLPE